MKLQFRIVLLLLMSAPAFSHATSHSTSPGADLAESTMADGEVRRIDKEARKLTIRHGPIRNLDMPPMTMVFQVEDARLLDTLKPGDKVRFSAEKAGGAYTATHIEVTK